MGWNQPKVSENQRPSRSPRKRSSHTPFPTVSHTIRFRISDMGKLKLLEKFILEGECSR